jgi:hypothetical protein
MTQIKTWLLCSSIVMGVLYLNAALERPETDELTAQVSNDRAAEWVAMKGKQ